MMMMMMMCYTFGRIWAASKKLRNWLCMLCVFVCWEWTIDEGLVVDCECTYMMWWCWLEVLETFNSPCCWCRQGTKQGGEKSYWCCLVLWTSWRDVTPCVMLCHFQNIFKRHTETRNNCRMEMEQVIESYEGRRMMKVIILLLLAWFLLIFP